VKHLNIHCTTQPKALTFLSMLYVMIIIAADVVIYKIAKVGPFVFTVGSLIIPFWFLLTDIIAEVYGYELTRQLIWFGIICSILFTFLCSSLINLPSPQTWQHQASYDFILGKLPRILLGYIMGVFAGAFLNTYLISKWKILTKGKYFWLRSIGSSGIGQLVFTIVTLSLDMLGILPFNKIVQAISISFSIKIFITALAALPCALIIIILKKFENIQTQDYQIDYNIFSLSVTNQMKLNHTL
jgi:uncharacterized integral membrane protein (TIGR00697 family)